MYLREIELLFEDRFVELNGFFCPDLGIWAIVRGVIKIHSGSRNKNKIYASVNEEGTDVNIEYNNKIFSQKDLVQLVYFTLEKHKIIKLNESTPYKNLWKHDSVFLLFTVLHILKITNKSLDVLMSRLPDFWLAECEVNLPETAGCTALKLSGAGRVRCKSNCFVIPLNGAGVKIKKSFSPNKAKIVCLSSDYAYSKELCDFFSDLFQGGNA